MMSLVTDCHDVTPCIATYPREVGRFLEHQKLYEIAAFANSRKSVNPHYLMTRCFDQTGSIRGSGKQFQIFFSRETVSFASWR